MVSQRLKRLGKVIIVNDIVPTMRMITPSPRNG
jgi:hypothetical protein